MLAEELPRVISGLAWSVVRFDPVQLVAPQTKAEFIQQCWRQRGYERRCVDLRPANDGTIEAIRPRCLVGVRPCMFTRGRSVDAMFLIEVMIDPQIRLIP